MKTIKALEAEVPARVLNDLNHIFLGWKFQNEEKTFHIIIDVEWLLEHEKDNPECTDVEDAIETLTSTFGKGWRKTKLLYIKSDFH